jgi:hypothetical protein
MLNRIALEENLEKLPACKWVSCFV